MYHSQTLRLSGSSCLPAYPGFMVMNTVQEGSRDISVPSNMNLLTPWLMATWMLWICWAITESTSSSMRLNSSKQAHAPAWAKPLKNLPMALKSRPSEQLNTTHCLATALAKSLQVSVLPVLGDRNTQN